MDQDKTNFGPKPVEVGDGGQRFKRAERDGDPFGNGGDAVLEETVVLRPPITYLLEFAVELPGSQNEEKAANSDENQN